MTHPEIFLVRHGETTWNRIGRHQGQFQPPGQGNSVLTLNGTRQARGVGRRLAREITDWNNITIACSTLFRCQQTAVIICDEVGVDVERIVYDNRLMERCYGHWEGLTDAEIIARYPDECAAREADKWNHVIPGGGENYPATGARLAAWLAEQAPDRPVLVVTHGEAGRALRWQCLGLSPADVLTLAEPQTAAFHLVNGQSRLLEGDFPTGEN